MHNKHRVIHIFSLYSQHREGKYGKFCNKPEELLTSMTNRLNALDDVQHKSGITSLNEPVVAFVTPLMRRAHTIR